MLPRSARLTSPDDFARTTKTGFRVTVSSLVGYLHLTHTQTPALCGLIISKNVGGSVVRHRIARQLRHNLRAHLELLPQGSRLVIRALPSALTSNLTNEIELLIPKLLIKSSVQK
ncbi:MAG: ribonuclease P protein component [Actinobacteria bacterium]|nr:ribonuclease P protein component [Actinomycetota bacterium]